MALSKNFLLVAISSIFLCSVSAKELIRRQNLTPPAQIKNSTSCPDLPINPSTWKSLGIDQYLKTYPSGNTLSLQDYAFAHHAQNFICGIGEGCHAGQLCNPITAPDWYVLYATQEWNAVQNAIYTAVGFAVSMVQATAAAMVTDFYPPEHKSILYKLNDLFVLLGAVAFTVSVLTLLFSGPATLVVGAAIGGALATGTSAILTGVNLVNSWDVKPDGFTKWSNYAYYLSQWQSKVQDQLANSTATVVQSGISSANGIAEALKDGTYLTDVEIKPTSDIEDDIKRTMSARILVDIMRNQGGYVTYGSDPCTGKGPNGAWDGDKVISFCQNGTMMNIVRAKGKKTKNTWHNAQLIATKYNLTAEYLTTQSVECQKKYKAFGYDPYRSGALPKTPMEECIVNLPVCDCTNPEIKRAIKKGATTTVACREVGKLPI